MTRFRRAFRCAAVVLDQTRARNRRRSGARVALLCAAVALLFWADAAYARSDVSGRAALQRIHEALAAGTALPAEHASVTAADLKVLDLLRDPLWELGAFWLHTTPEGKEVAEYQVRDGAGEFAFIRLSRLPSPDSPWTLVHAERLSATAFLPHEGSRFLFADARGRPRSAAEALRRCWMRGYETRRNIDVVREALSTHFDVSSARGGIDELAGLLADGLREPSVGGDTAVAGQQSTVLRVESDLGFDVRRLEVEIAWPPGGGRPRVLRVGRLEDGTVVVALNVKQVSQFHDWIRRIRGLQAGGPPPPVLRLRGPGPLCIEDTAAATAVARAAAAVLPAGGKANESPTPSAVTELGVTVVSAFVKSSDGEPNAIEFVLVGDSLCLRCLLLERRRLSYGIPLGR